MTLRNHIQLCILGGSGVPCYKPRLADTAALVRSLRYSDRLGSPHPPSVAGSARVVMSCPPRCEEGRYSWTPGPPVPRCSVSCSCQSCSGQCVYAACACCMCMLHVHAACACCVCMLRVHAACACCVCMLRVHAACCGWVLAGLLRPLQRTDEDVSSGEVVFPACLHADSVGDAVRRRWPGAGGHLRLVLT